MTSASTEIAQAFLRACWLDVAVRKAGNVSVASAGHRMQADLFVRSARAAAGSLCTPGARVGTRIETAMAASWAAAGCNTNLGILLLCAPVARAAERAGPCRLQAALGAVLDELDVDDARAAYRAIARANPGGLGSAPEQDVHAAPTLGLRAAMALAADRDLIARQYANGYADLFDVALPALPSVFPPGSIEIEGPVEPAIVAAVQAVYLRLLAAFPDSHIVRKHGAGVAQNVMAAAQPWAERAAQGERLDADPAYAAWDEALKRVGINPGTTADFAVATLFVAGLMGGSAAPA
ncbi:MAG: triphosphoribosyl-dephospho-CoA synthase [Proteobacteria bacterium]|nr:triphosphoribosyl-dephospho-CoA synthase [Pseudomonadota bacterium]